MYNKDYLSEMLNLQMRINNDINKGWMKVGYDWYLAIGIETAEAIEHLGWKWWKHPEPDMKQVELELIDIWHFILSKKIEVFNGNIVGAVASISTITPQCILIDGIYYDYKDYSILQKLRLVLSLAFVWRFDCTLFNSILEDCNIPQERLYSLYVGKNALNKLRQNYGYKQGNYEKLWDGHREDNEYLHDIITESRGNFTFDSVYLKLEHKYLELTDI